MKPAFLVKFLGLLLVVGLLSACGAKGRTVVMVDDGEIVPGKTVSLRVKSGPNVERKDFVEVSRRFHFVLSNLLVNDGIFESVVDVGEPADYGMIATIEQLDMRGLANSGQRMGGIHVDVRIIDEAAEKEIKSFLAIGAGRRAVSGPYGIGAPQRDINEAMSVVLIEIIEALRAAPGQST